MSGHATPTGDDLNLLGALQNSVDRAIASRQSAVERRDLLEDEDGAPYPEEVQAIVRERDHLHAEKYRAWKDEVDEYDQILTRQGALLTGVVNAIKGDPPELTTWSHHDAPELAAKVVAERDEARTALARAKAEALREFADVLMDETPGCLTDHATCLYFHTVALERAADIEAVIDGPKPEASSPCCNYREGLDKPCDGTARLFPGEQTYVCDTCGARCGRLAHPNCATPDTLEDGAELHAPLDDGWTLGRALFHIDDSLRNGNAMTRANLAFDLLCDYLGIDRDALPEPNPCGHEQTVKGCGGCDPGAGFVMNDGGPLRRVEGGE